MNDYDLVGLVDEDILYGGDHDIIASHQSGSANVVKTAGMVFLGALFGAGLFKVIQNVRGSASKHDQGYNDRRRESLAMRDGPQKDFQHGKYSISETGRMHDSYGVFGHQGTKGPMKPM